MSDLVKVIRVKVGLYLHVEVFWGPKHLKFCATIITPPLALATLGDTTQIGHHDIKNNDTRHDDCLV